MADSLTPFTITRLKSNKIELRTATSRREDVPTPDLLEQALPLGKG